MSTYRALRWTISLMTLSLLLLLGAKQMFAASSAQEGHIYLPLVSSGGNGQSATSTPVTPTPVTPTPVPATATPVTPTAQPTPQPTAQPQANDPALFLEKDWRTSSATIKKDSKGGNHAAYYFYEGQNDGAPNYAIYAYCAVGCDTLANWAKVKLAENRDVIEVQMALTSAGQPRILIRADSTVYPGGKDYLYAACNQQCTTQANWQVGYVLTSDGTDIFDTTDDNSPQHSFALDPQDRPRLIFQDRNYAHAEPDHYGHYYVTCNSNCTGGTPEKPTWQQTRITDEFTENFRFEYEILEYPTLTFTKAGAPRIFGYLIPTSHSATPEGLYYLGCDTGCDNRANWQRVYLLDRGSGTAVSWNLTLDSQDRPRVALYRGTGTFEAEKLLYLWCNTNCLDQPTKDEHWEFNDPGVEVTNGRHPDLKLNAQGKPRIAYVDEKAGGLGFAWCTADCESDNAVWQHQTVENYITLQTSWPVPLPVSCVDGLWHGLTPILSLDVTDKTNDKTNDKTTEKATVAYDTTYHAQCLYDDPSDGKPPFTAFHLIVRAVRVVAFEAKE